MVFVYLFQDMQGIFVSFEINRSGLHQINCLLPPRIYMQKFSILRNFVEILTFDVVSNNKAKSIITVL